MKRWTVLLIVTATAWLTACDGEDKSRDVGDRIGVNRPSLRLLNAVQGMNLNVYRTGMSNGLNIKGQDYGSISKFKEFNDDISTFAVRSSANGREVGVNSGFKGEKGHRYSIEALPDTTPAWSI
jgi:hypothetical protein